MSRVGSDLTMRNRKSRQQPLTIEELPTELSTRAVDNSVLDEHSNNVYQMLII